MAGKRCDAPVIFGATGDVAKLETFPEVAGLVERERSTNPPPDLDPDARQALTADLLQATEGRTVLFITHNISEAVYLSDRIGVMNSKPGRLNNVIDVDLARPRLPSLRSEADYYDVVRTVRRLIGPMHEATDAPAGAA